MLATISCVIWAFRRCCNSCCRCGSSGRGSSGCGRRTCRCSRRGGGSTSARKCFEC